MYLVIFVIMLCDVVVENVEDLSEEIIEQLCDFCCDIKDRVFLDSGFGVVLFDFEFGEGVYVVGLG